MAKDSYQDGMKFRRRVLGDAWVDRSLANRNDFNAEIQRQITSHVWGDNHRHHMRAHVLQSAQDQLQLVLAGQKSA
jgi:hypothetical protein